MKFLHD